MSLPAPAREARALTDVGADALAAAARRAARRADPENAQALAELRLGVWARAADEARLEKAFRALDFARALEIPASQAARAAGRSSQERFAGPAWTRFELPARTDAARAGLDEPARQGPGQGEASREDVGAPDAAIARAQAFAQEQRRRARRGEPPQPLEAWRSFDPAGAEPEPDDAAFDVAGRAAHGLREAAFPADRFALYAGFDAHALAAGRVEAFARRRLAVWAQTRAGLGEDDLAAALERLGLPARAEVLEARAEADFVAGLAGVGAGGAFAADLFALHARFDARALDAGRVEAFARQRLALWAQAQDRRRRPALPDALSHLDWRTRTEPLEDRPEVLPQLEEEETPPGLLLHLARRVVPPRFLPRRFHRRNRTKFAVERAAPRQVKRRLAEARAAQLLDALRRAVRYGREEEVARLMEAHGGALAGHAKAAVALAGLAASPAPSFARRPSKAGGATGQAAAAFLAAIDAPAELTRLAANFPFAEAGLDVAATADLPPPSRATGARARRSLAWFRAGAPALPPGPARIEARELGAPRLICAGDAVFAPRATDRRDPGLIWLALLAHRCADLAAPALGSAERRAYRAAFIAAFAPWAAIVEMTRLAPPASDPPRAVEGPGWLSRNHPAAAQGPSLVLQLRRGGKALIAAREGLDLACYDLAARRFVDARHRALSLEAAIGRSAAAIATAPNAALSCALRGVETIFVAGPGEGARLPDVARLTIVSEAELEQALTLALARNLARKSPAA